MPIGGECLVNNLVYQATVTPNPQNNGMANQDPPKAETYIGLCAPPFKTRLANHKKSFKFEKYRKETILSQYIWGLKNENVDFDIKWKIVDRAKPFSPVSGICGLCTSEKYYIIFKPELASLNKKEEINNYCLHKSPVLLDKT